MKNAPRSFPIRERAGGGKKNGEIPPGTWKGGDAVSKGKRNMNFEKKWSQNEDGCPPALCDGIQAELGLLYPRKRRKKGGKEMCVCWDVPNVVDPFG